MGKKYQPSGYQIIDLSDLDIVAEIQDFHKNETTDTKVLYDLLVKGITKPILLKCKSLLGFAVVNGSTLSLNYAQYDEEGIINTLSSLNVSLSDNEDYISASYYEL